MDPLCVLVLALGLAQASEQLYLPTDMSLENLSHFNSDIGDHGLKEDDSLNNIS